MGSAIFWIFDIIGIFVFYLTGELLLYIVTLGKHSIRNSKNKADRAGHYARRQLYFEASYYIGIAFWIGLFVAVQKYVF